MDIYKIIERPLYTERATMMKEKENRYVFKVACSASKPEIRHAVEELFNVKVLNVRTAIFSGKRRRLGMHEGVRPSWKKAIVRLKKGQEIKPIDVQT